MASQQATSPLSLLALALLPLSAGQGVAPLLKAIEGNNPSQINMALKSTHPKLLNEVDAAGMTPLMTAVTHGKHKVIKALLKAGPTATTIANAEGYSVMHVAADLGRDRVIQILITHGLDPRDRHEDGLTPMHRAVSKGHTDTVKSLFNAELSGTAINALNDERTADGRSLMDLAPDLATKEVLSKFSRATKPADESKGKEDAESESKAEL